MRNTLLYCCLVSVALLIAPAVFAQKEFYIPKAVLMPFHNRQQQLYASAGIGGGYDVNLSYSFSPHIALFATGTFDNGTGKRVSFFGDNYDILKHDQALTYGAGYFKPRKSKLNVLETYVGYGTYKVNNYWFFTSEPGLGNTYTQTSYRSIFWQVTIGRKTLKYEYGFAGRLSYNSYADVLFYDSNPNEVYDKSSYKNVKGLNIDPAVCFGYHLKMISLNVQAGISAPLTSSRHTLVNTYTIINNGVTDITHTEGTETDPLLAAFVRLSIQYTLNAGKNKSK